MKTYNVKISVGDKIAVGKFRNSIKTIKSIELEDGQPIIVTSAGKRKLLNFKTKNAKTGIQSFSGGDN